MRQRIIVLLLLLAAWNMKAQKTFSHGPGQGIGAQYFDSTLAPFYHGVASGDPLDDRVIIWTRVTPQNDTLIPVQWKMATDTGFNYIVAQGTITTDYTQDYTVKVDVTGLQPGVIYYYYFSALGGNSIIGRTHTLPVSTVQHLRFAVVSCVNYQMGYFNAYKRIAERNDLDAVLHLGDYLYEYATYQYGYSAAVGRTHQPDHEVLTLDDYQIRHSFYKLDPDLRAAHQQHPFICIWDDHEIANNTWEHGAANHDSTTEGDFETRKQSAIRAYLQWMPIRHEPYVNNAKIYRRFIYGSLADLEMLDTRVEDRDKQAPSAGSPLLQDSTRRILGDVQRNWLMNNLEHSTSTWKILGNQITFSQDGPAPATDAWTGYPAERAMVIQGLQNLPTKNNIILTGDTHRSWAYDLTEHPFDTSYYQPLTGMGTFGVELCTPSVASPNRDESSPGTSQTGLVQAEYLVNPHLRFVDLDNHGYFILDITQVKAQADYFYVDTKFRSSRDSFGTGVFTYVNDGYLQTATSPASPKPAVTPAPEGPAGFMPYIPTDVKPFTGILVSGVYPNPVYESLFVGLVLNKSKSIMLELVDMQGRVMQQHRFDLTAGNHKIQLVVDGLARGSYMLLFADEEGDRQVKKIILE